jgi:hypothetical protein
VAVVRTGKEYPEMGTALAALQNLSVEDLNELQDRLMKEAGVIAD